MFKSLSKLSNNKQLFKWVHLMLEALNLLVIALLFINLIYPLSFLNITWRVLVEDHLIWSASSGIVLFLGFINVHLFATFDDNSILNTLHANDLKPLGYGVGLLIISSIISLILSFIPWSITMSWMSNVAIGLFFTMTLQAHLLVGAFYYSTVGSFGYQLANEQKHLNRKQHTIDMIQRIYDGTRQL